MAALGLHYCVGFFLVVANRGYSWLQSPGSHCSGFSCGAWSLGCMGFSSCGSQALEHRLDDCGAQA